MIDHRKTLSVRNTEEKFSAKSLSSLLSSENRVRAETMPKSMSHTKYEQRNYKHLDTFDPRIKDNNLDLNSHVASEEDYLTSSLSLSDLEETSRQGQRKMSSGFQSTLLLSEDGNLPKEQRELLSQFAKYPKVLTQLKLRQHPSSHRLCRKLKSIQLRHPEFGSTLSVDIEASNETLNGVTQEINVPIEGDDSLSDFQIAFDNRKEPVDLMLLNRALKIALAENRVLQNNVYKSKIKNKQLMLQLFQELEARSNQHHCITEAIHYLQAALASKVNSEVSRRKLKYLNKALHALYEALSTTSCENQSKSPGSAMEGVTSSETSSFGDEMATTEITKQDSGASNQGTEMSLSEGSYKQFRQSNESVRDIISITMRNAASNYAPSVEVEIESDPAKSFPHGPSTKTLQLRPKVPVLSLKENNVGYGAWLSGCQTQGDTYSGAA